MPSAAIYARFSSDLQSRETIAVQVDHCTRYCASNSFTVVSTYIDEAVSGRTERREQYQQMVSDAQAGQFQAIVVYRYDRLARDFLDVMVRLRELRLFGVTVLSATETNDPRMRAFSFALAESESATTSQRVLDALRSRVRNQTHMGVPPYGYEKESGTLTEHPIEAPIVREIFRLYSDGIGSVQIRDRMNASGAPTRKGGPWQVSTVCQILKNPVYTGALVYNRTKKQPTPTGHKLAQKPESEWEWIEDCHPALVSRSDWDRIQAHKKPAGHPKGVFSGKYLLTGFCFCASCSASYVTRTHPGRQRKYACKSVLLYRRISCPHSPRLIGDKTDRIIASLVADMIDPTQISSYLKTEQKRKTPDNSQSILKTEKSIGRIVKAIRDIGHSQALADELKRQESYLEHLKAEGNGKPATDPKTAQNTASGWRDSLKTGDLDVPALRRIFHDIDLRISVSRYVVNISALPFGIKAEGQFDVANVT